MWGNYPKRSPRASKGVKHLTEDLFKTAWAKHDRDVMSKAFANYLAAVSEGQMPKDAERFWREDYWRQWVEVDDGPVFEPNQRKSSAGRQRDAFATLMAEATVIDATAELSGDEI